MSSKAFEEAARRWLSSFQLDLKDFMHVVCDDMELDDPLREAAAAAVLYALAPGDVIPDSAGPLGYVDDALALRIVLAEVADRAPARFEAYLDRLPEMAEPVHDDLNTSRAFLGELFELFRARVLEIDRVEFKGKRVRDVLADPEWLDDEVAVASLKLDFKPESVQSAVRRLHTVPDYFRSKLLPRK